ncbi:thioredoxin domain-containing protein [Aureimonas ureilytica]|uniref:thioredoxin domain-containing protein n=1 Tax=Aureimonas ureilytica TaxID=401562 RepID=UPI000373E4E8|nr:thioredoxin domain-containing protein [Aureimonas ureilytica]
MTEGNQLGAAISPYLLQHRDNPVHWREWSAEALAEAAREDKPILLSIGYAACHWCHVMAHESFENEAVAAVMNRLFVNIKVDREERPDIDHLYMTALQAMGEQGGWPMTLFLTPTGEPFYGGTYYPPQAAHGRPGFGQLLEAVRNAWDTKRDSLLRSASQMRAHLQTHLSGTAAPIDLPESALAEAAERLSGLIDKEWGGMRGAPKFPNAPYLELLARSGFPNGPAAHREAFLLTLRSLCEGGIYDHVGGGLHRYATDARWLVPHFEKMLPDQAQFLRHLVWGWRATGEPLFRQRAEETVAFLRREMQVEGGGLAASLDADSADETGRMVEGAFYRWREAEVDAALQGLPDIEGFKRAYSVTPPGNWDGWTVLDRLGGSGDAAPAAFGEARIRLFQARQARPRPGRDDKILADWNGLAIRALAEAGAAFHLPDALGLAREAFDFVIARMMRADRLHHATRAGRLSGPALASDYGAMIAAAAALFVATLDARFLETGNALAEALERWHGDGEGGHFMTASDAGDMPLRPRGDPDDAVPGATALVVEGLALLAQAGGEARFGERAERAARLAQGRIGPSGMAYPGLLAGFDRLARGSELALFGFRSNPGFEAMEDTVRRAVDLNRIDLVLNDPARLPETLALSAFAPERYPAVTLCRNRTCHPPVFETQALAALLGEGRSAS